MAPNPPSMKSSLISYGWLMFALDGPSVDEMLKAQLRNSSPSSPLNYDPLRYDDMLSDVSSLLDRCLTYRREYEELKASAIRQGLEYQLFKTQTPSVKAIEMSAWQLDLRSADAQGQEATAAKFGLASGSDKLADGFQQAALAARDSANKAFAAETKRQALVQEKWDVLVDYQASLEARHTEPGNPLAYNDRANKVRRFLLEDFSEAVDKSLAIGVGVRIALGVEPGFGWLVSATPLDDLIKWTRGIIRELDRRSHTEMQVVFRWWTPTRSLLQAPVFRLGAPECEGVSFEQAAFEQWSSIRIKSISVRFSFDPTKVSNPNRIESTVVIFQSSVSSIIIDDVSALWSDSQNFTSGRSLVNAPLFPNLKADTTGELALGAPWPDPGWGLQVPRLFASDDPKLTMADLMANSGIEIKIRAVRQRPMSF